MTSSLAGVLVRDWYTPSIQTKPLTPEAKQRHEYLMSPPSGVVKRSIIGMIQDTEWAQSFPTMTAYRLALVKAIGEMR